MTETETDIIQRCLNGDRDAYCIFVERYQAMVYNIACRMLGDEDAARDAAQDSFIAAYGSLKKFKKDSKFSTWLVSILLNKCRDVLRRRKNSVPIEDMEGTLQNPEPNPEDVLRRGQRGEGLQKALAGLPGEYREALVLKHVQGLDYKEMAALTGVSIGALKVRTYRAREMLRELLKKEGFSDERR